MYGGLPMTASKPSFGEDLRELPLPVERVDPLPLLLVGEEPSHVGGLDEGVSAADVSLQARERPLPEQSELPDRLLRLAFEDLQEERELRDLDGLRVDVDAVDAAQEDGVLLGRRQAPLLPPPEVDRLLVAGGIVRLVPRQVLVEEELVGLEQERPRAAGGIEDLAGSSAASASFPCTAGRASGR